MNNSGNTNSSSTKKGYSPYSMFTPEVYENWLEGEIRWWTMIRETLRFDRHVFRDDAAKVKSCKKLQKELLKEKMDNDAEFEALVKKPAELKAALKDVEVIKGFDEIIPLRIPRYKSNLPLDKFLYPMFNYPPHWMRNGPFYCNRRHIKVYPQEIFYVKEFRETALALLPDVYRRHHIRLSPRGFPFTSADLPWPFQWTFDAMWYVGSSTLHLSWDFVNFMFYHQYAARAIFYFVCGLVGGMDSPNPVPGFDLQLALDFWKWSIGMFLFDIPMSHVIHYSFDPVIHYIDWHWVHKTLYKKYPPL